MNSKHQASAKNVAIIIDSMAGGGAEKVMLTLAETLSSQSHRVTIFILKDSIDYRLPTSLTIIHALKGYKKKLRSWRRRLEQSQVLLGAINKAENTLGAFDLILVNLYESMKLAQVLNLPNTFYVMHNDCDSELRREFLMGPIKYLYMRKILQGLDGKRLIGVSKSLTDSLDGNPLFKPLSKRCIYNPLDIKRVRDLANQPCDSMPSKFIVHVGRAAKAKRHDVLFKAMADVKADYQLVCLSSGTKKLKKLAVKHGVENRVTLPGFEQNPYPWIKAASLLVLSSDFEGLAMVLIEALACGTPVVATDCPYGPAEVLAGGLEDNLVPVNDPSSLAATIKKALEREFNVDNMPILKSVEPTLIAQQYISLIKPEEGHQ